MKKNIGSLDKIIRVTIAVVIGILYFTNQINGVTAIVSGIFAITFLLTSLAGFCPVYASFKISTVKKSK
jgi:hypothetical protein